MIYNVQLSEHHFPRLDAKANAIPNIEFFRTYDIVEKFTLHQHFVVASLALHPRYICENIYERKFFVGIPQC